LVISFVNCTLAPTTRASPASTTVPVIEPVTVWAFATGIMVNSGNTKNASALTDFISTGLPFVLQTASSIHPIASRRSCRRDFFFLCDLLSANFTGVGPGGADVYQVKFEKGSLEYRIWLGPDGEIESANVRPSE
jgi:hypothetical protein